MNILLLRLQRRQCGLKSGGYWIRVNKISIFSGKFPRNFDFFRQLKKIDFRRETFKKLLFFQENLIFSGKFLKNFNFFRQFVKKKLISRQKFLIYSYFWANYSISLQKSPLLNILPVHMYMITL